MDELWRILAVFGLILGNAFLVTAEYAVVTARRGPLLERAEGGSTAAATALGLMDDPVKVISTVQVGITAIGILTGAIGEPLVRDLLGEGLPAPLGFLIAFGIVTYLTVVFGELVPKAISLERSEALVRLVAAPVTILGVVLRPIVWMFDGSARAVLRLFGIRRVVAGQSVQTAGDLRAMVDEAEKSGVIPRAQEELLHRVFDFATLEAGDAMVPAHEVVWLDAAAAPDEALETVIDSVHTRFPVGEGSVDRIAGIVHTREIVAASRAGQPKTIGPLAREPFVVPETKDLGALLRELRQRREQFAIVASEYGVTQGIVTIEDILEEIVGEIESEYELPDASVERVDPRTLRIAGSITIDDFNESTGADLPLDGPKTIAGLVFDRLGRAAKPGDEVDIDGLELTVIEVEGARITRLQARLPEPASD